MIPDAPTFVLVPLRPLPVDGGSTLLEADPAAEWVDLREENGEVPLSLDAAGWAFDSWVRSRGDVPEGVYPRAKQIRSVVAPDGSEGFGLVGVPLAICKALSGLVWGIWRAGDVQREGARL